MTAAVSCGKAVSAFFRLPEFYAAEPERPSGVRPVAANLA